MKLTMKKLEETILKAYAEKKNYIGVKVEMSDFKSDEIIINDYYNMLGKLDYYKRAYNEDLTLKSAPDKVKIVGVIAATSYEGIQEYFVGNVKYKNSLNIDVNLNINSDDIKNIAIEAQEKLIDSLKRNISLNIK
ncbi:Uncharacterised protein [uncultured Clostridium sp.]|nr:Uncharacterised protein [uncultured Clostridium sp.]